MTPLAIRPYLGILLTLCLLAGDSQGAQDETLAVMMVADDSQSYQGFLLTLQDTVSGGDPLIRRLMTSLVDRRAANAPVAELAIDGRRYTVSLYDPDRLPAAAATTDPGRWDALCAQAQITVAVGPDSASLAPRACDNPTLLALLPRYRADALLASAARDRPLTAIYLEADPTLNLQLIRNAMPAARLVGVLARPEDSSLVRELDEKATTLGLTLRVIQAEDDASAVRRLRRQLGDIDALLLLPEATLVNDWSLKPLLLMTARERIPVFGGLTARYVAAGVTAAVVPNIDGLQRQIRATAAQLAAGKVPPSAYPDDNLVIYNKTVARHLVLRPERFTLDAERR